MEKGSKLFAVGALILVAALAFPVSGFAAASPDSFWYSFGYRFAPRYSVQHELPEMFSSSASRDGGGEALSPVEPPSPDPLDGGTPCLAGECYDETEAGSGGESESLAPIYPPSPDALEGGAPCLAGECYDEPEAGGGESESLAPIYPPSPDTLEGGTPCLAGECFEG